MKPSVPFVLRMLLLTAVVLTLAVPGAAALPAAGPPNPAADPATKIGQPDVLQAAIPGPLADPGADTIYLLNGPLTPDRGLDSRTGPALTARAATAQAMGAGPVHALVQLDFIPTADDKEKLAGQGLKLQVYVPNRAWIAAISRSPAEIAAIPGVRWVGDWWGESKLHPDILADNWPSWAVHPTEDKVMVMMQLHEDVPLARGPELAAAFGGVALDPIVGIHGMTVWLPRAGLRGLAREDAVLWLEPGPPPLSPTNDGVRGTMQVDPLYSTPYNLNGSGVRVFVYDGGLVRTTHNTFNPGSRVTQIETGGGTVDDHPTHVAGTVAGDGDGGRAKGVAPSATLLSAEYDQTGGTMLFWDNAGDLEADYARARNTYNADLGTNSIGSNTAANGYDCAREGDYGVTSNLVDGIVRGDNGSVNGAVLMTWANGNERTGGSPSGRCGSNYLTTAPPACAKNPIHVGAINSDYDSMTSFSSWGPCDDGRMKPVVSAPGCELGRATGETYVYSSLATNDSAYGGSGWCGTSMATPAVAGVVALMTQQWRNLGYGGAYDRPLPALVKAMLIHTARDKGQPGPDYIYGYGEVDAQAAIDLIRAGQPLGSAGPTVWGTDTITQGATDSFTINVAPGTAELKASLAWDDYAAAAFTSSAPVNNLNLELVAPDSTVYRAWVLNAAAPYQAATTGTNNLDNQEQVVVTNPASGTWTVRVVGAAVPQGPQSYGLVYTASDPLYDAASCTEQILNGGFETNSDWTLSGATRSTAQKHSGSYALLLGNANNASHTAYQAVTIPSGSRRAELAFWWYMTTNETTHPYDKFYAEVRNTSGTVLATFDYRSDGWQTGQWMQAKNMDLTPWAGQTVRIYFYATTDSLYTTSFWVDDVSLSTCPEAAGFTISASPASQAICTPADAIYTVDVGKVGSFSGSVTLSASGHPAGTTAGFSANPVTPPASSTLTIGNTGAAAAGSYTLTVTGVSGSLTRQTTAGLTVYTAAPGAAVLTAPADGSTGINTTPTFTWNAATQAATYDLQVATDPAFANLVIDQTGLTGTSYTPGSPLSNDTIYYWRVKASNACGNQFSVTFAFRTVAAGCTTYTSTDVPKTINDNSTVESNLVVPDSITISDVNVTIGQITHTWDGDLDIYILHPDNTQVELSTDNGGSGDNYVNTVFDDEASTPITSGTPPFTGSFRPEGLLSALDGKTSNGTWKLRVTDDATGDTGTLQAWSVTICGTVSSAEADYSDLASSYGVAWHAGNGAVRLGSLWDADSAFSNGFDDGRSDDGITRGGWSETTGAINATVNGATGYVTGWFDWNQDGDFADAGEQVFSNEQVNAGQTKLITFSTNGNSVYGKTISARFRAYAAPQTALAAAAGPDALPQALGAAPDGEVEDYTWYFSPLAVTLAAFTADATPAGVTLAWETVSEQDNAGFNLYRAEAILGSNDFSRSLSSNDFSRSTGPWTRLNAALIPAAAPGSSEGHSYTWTDATAVPGVTYWYRLEDVALDGAATQHPPVQVTLAGPNAVGLVDFFVVTTSVVTLTPSGVTPFVVTTLVVTITLAALAAAAARRR